MAEEDASVGWRRPLAIVALGVGTFVVATLLSIFVISTVVFWLEGAPSDNMAAGIVAGIIALPLGVLVGFAVCAVCLVRVTGGARRAQRGMHARP